MTKSWHTVVAAHLHCPSFERYSHGDSLSQSTYAAKQHWTVCRHAALQGAKGGRRDSLKRPDKQASHQSLNGLAEEHAAGSASLQTSSGERKALLTRLQGPQQSRGDLDELLAAAARVLQDTGVNTCTAFMASPDHKACFDVNHWQLLKGPIRSTCCGNCGLYAAAGGLLSSSEAHTMPSSAAATATIANLMESCSSTQMAFLALSKTLAGCKAEKCCIAAYGRHTGLSTSSSCCRHVRGPVSRGKKQQCSAAG